jgi:processing peptidase subunit beta
VFAGLPTTPSGPAVITNHAPAYFTGSDIRVRDDEVRSPPPSSPRNGIVADVFRDQMPHAHVAVAFESVELTHPDSPATMVIQALLGSFDASVPSAINATSKMISTLAGHNARQYPLVKSAMTFNTQYRCSARIEYGRTGICR